MHRFSFLSALIAVVLIPCVELNAQSGVLTLHSARTAARNTHPSIRAALDRARAARAEAGVIGTRANPTLMVDREAAGSEAGQSSQIIAQVEQPLDIWGRRPARRRAGALLAEAADLRAALAVALVEEQVTVAFAAAVAATWRETAARQTLVAFDRAVTIITEREAAGDAAGVDGRRLRLERTRALAVLVGAEHGRHTSLGALAGLMAEPPTAFATVDLRMDTLPDFTPPISLDSLGVVARLAAGEVRALELESRAAAQTAIAADKARIPIPSLRLGAKWEHGDDIPDRRGLVAGLSVPIPLWNGGSAAVEAAHANADASTGDLEAASRSLELVLYESWEGLRDHADAFLELHAQIEENGSAIIDAIDVAFAEGELTVTEWLDALRTNHETIALHADLWLELVGRLAHLERLTGLALFQETL